MWLVRKNVPLAMFGWALHILIDIPSHSISLYPTPFLWPISEYRFPYGVSWANQTFMIINYSALLIVWIFLIIYASKKSKISHGVCATVACEAQKEPYVGRVVARESYERTKKFIKDTLGDSEDQ